MKKIESYFLPLDELERQQRKTGIWCDEFEEEKDYPDHNYLKIQNKLFMENKTIIIRKHRRFAHYPLHSHHFMEFNYMLQGESKQLVNGEKLVLKEKQVLLLDCHSQHELFPLGENDLLINFLFKTSDINLSAFKQIDIENTGVTYDFLLNTVLDSEYHENHLLLDLTDHPEIHLTFEQMIREFFSETRLSNQVLTAFSQVLFLQLSQVYHAQLSTIYHSNTSTVTILKVLQRIEENAKELSLQSLATELGYNRNYLSNLIKKETGKTFKQLIIEQRLHEAHHLLLTTKVPIEVISEYVGFSNKTQFYQKFKHYFNETPQRVRDMK
ncbi:AraC family transcriptional regulator [Enterococcus florum]|uniref:AraC family transcriptional regulator n=1 Tax=Enterococcus florum TaxID=2480627 RepID=A0A4P5PC04_9ENTE|nr:AraC family transcriptional regulator [Enterococcus florum]GCF95296.1 AraC family transcriptional regulator [Enterococcus florum]